MTSHDSRHLRWRKSSHSGSAEDHCVEVALAWRKSSHSGSAQHECVEVAQAGERLVAVRDSKDPDGPMLMISGSDFGALLRAFRAG